MYADDITLYFDMTTILDKGNQLRTAIGILDSFHQASGLKINTSKCKCVWFGSSGNSKEKLCPEINLEWGNTFTVLGIDFDCKLINMHQNFKKKLKDIQKLYASWMYRNLSPLGKVTVVKSLALSKLTHVVLVAPHGQENMLNELIKESYKFVWSSKPDRIKRRIAVLPVREGGLNMPDIKNFWNSLKVSWARRIGNSNAAWKTILDSDLKTNNTNLEQLWYFGTEDFIKIAGKINNPFWQEVFISFSNTLKALSFSNPENIFYQNLFGNFLILREGHPLKRSNFPTQITKNIFQVGDLFNVGMERLLTYEEFKNTYGVETNFLTFESLKSSLKAALQKIGSPPLNYSDCLRPRQPALLKLFGNSKRGCGKIYQILMAKNKFNATTATETIWHNCLATNFSIKFWSKIYKLPHEANLENRLKFLQIQINLHTLPTNYSVSKYNPLTHPNCTFCNEEPERLEHLFFSCRIVQILLNRVKPYLETNSIQTIFIKRHCIFGSSNSDGDSCENLILMLTRGFIWRQKAQKSNLSFDNWKNYVKNKLELQKLGIYFTSNDSKILDFDLKWSSLLNEL